ncbi:MAG TPA: helix-turn-helix transcriptional regulator [Acetobacteraceae bacterium]|jgi:transcriptional regulator with XRE-family HTH domain|nr:helix-turn-helix transcriptional regulator [Acetobacteraceae bacterium]
MEAQNPLGDFLRSRRERLSPAALGLETLRHRRTPGLRREEVAERAGIGVDWYIRLEQGRAESPSASTVEALARALCLAPVEHDHLRALARLPARRPFMRETVPDAIRRIVTSLKQPAYVSGARWDVLAWNRAATRAIVDFARIKEDDRNILLFALTNPAARVLFGADWAVIARRMVTQFRAAHDLWAGDPAFAELVARLGRESREFARWWSMHDVGETRAGRKVLHHGNTAFPFVHASFQSNDDPALRLVIYTPCGEEE